MNHIAWLFIGTGLLIMVSAVPLIRRKIPMNKWIGVRFRSSFRSDSLWYDINEYGGWALVIASLSVVITGVVGLCVWPFAKSPAYPLMASAALTFYYLVAAVMTYRYGLRRERQEDSRDDLDS